MAIDVRWEVYVCECGYWKNERNLTIYAPINTGDRDSEESADSVIQDSEKIPFAWD